MLRYIYKIESLANGKIYIGLSINPYKRWKEHSQQLKRNQHNNKHLQNHFNKHGDDTYSFEVIHSEDCSEKRIGELERHYIEVYNSFKPNGFNQTLGGEGTEEYIHSNRSLTTEEVMKIKQILYFDIIQYEKLAEDWGINSKTPGKIKNKVTYKEVLIKFDSYEEYRVAEIVSRRYKLPETLEKLKVCYSWCKNNPNKNTIPKALTDNVHIATLLKSAKKLRDDYELGYIVKYLDEFNERNLKAKEEHRVKLHHTILTEFLKGKSYKEIADFTNTRRRYVNEVVATDKYKNHHPKLKYEASKRIEAQKVAQKTIKYIS